jgi:hypothetical protein
MWRPSASSFSSACRDGSGAHIDHARTARYHIDKVPIAEQEIERFEATRSLDSAGAQTGVVQVIVQV